MLRRLATARAMSTRLTPVHTDAAPAALGPYSQAIRVAPAASGMLFVSGQIPIDPATGAVVDGGVEAQTRQVMRNLSAVLRQAGAGLGDVVKTTVFLKNMNDFAAMNGVYSEAFGAWKPARAAIEVARLPKDVLVEVECVAALPA